MARLGAGFLFSALEFLAAELAVDLVSIFHIAPCCPWYLNEPDSTDLLSVGLALWAACQRWGWIYAHSLTLAFPDAFSPTFYYRMEQIC